MRRGLELTEELIRQSCSRNVYKRGTELYKEGRVHLRRREDSLIGGVVEDNGLYDVRIKLGSGGLSEFLCCCAYYEPMGCVCRHLAAALIARASELKDEERYSDENDRIAEALCGEYSRAVSEPEPISVGFNLYIEPHGSKGLKGSDEFAYSASIRTESGELECISEFLECAASGAELKLSDGRILNRNAAIVSESQKKIIFALAEAHQNKQIGLGGDLSHISFGTITMSRIMESLMKTDTRLIYDGMMIPSHQVRYEDPDIVIDIEAAENEISLSVSDMGQKLVSDGSWFLFEDTVYKTSEQWRGWFMPVYNALASARGARLSFKGDNTAAFASCVLPKLRDRHGVITHGTDELISYDKPEFSVYLDTNGRTLTAVIKAEYGQIALRLPTDGAAPNKIIVRDMSLESSLLDEFSTFSQYGGVWYLSDDEALYDFIIDSVPRIAKKAKIYASDAAAGLRVRQSSKISGRISYSAEIDLLEAGFTTDLSAEELRGIMDAIRLKKIFYRLNDGSFVETSGEKSFFDVLWELDFSNEELENGHKAVPKYESLYLASAAESGEAEIEDGFREYLEDIKSRRAKIPEALNGVLRNYQIEGMNWIKRLSEFGFGGILADDMGLGKTLQVIAYISGEKPELPTLIVAPSALTYNWLAEINRFTPDETALIIEGTAEQRKRLIQDVYKYRFVITSYPLLRRDAALYGEINFSYCFIDEAQYIKNPRTMNARGVKKIHAYRKFALTGTPIENSLLELWSIFDFIMPGYLKTGREFREKYETPIARENSSDAVSGLRTKIKPFIMRRMKYEVLSELPEKIEDVVLSELTAEQKNIYSAFLADARDQAYSYVQEGAKSRMRILTLIMRLRQICCHPALFDSAYKGGSGKLELLCELVKTAVDGGHRTLIFSQFTSMLSIIKRELDGMGISGFYLDGQTPSYERLEMTQRFNSGEGEVFLISLKAGGSGLNLTGADTVIHYDAWWNPAAVDQASDRAYRIGQTKAVQVIQLAARGTIEEKILELQRKKRALAEDIIEAGSAPLSSLSAEEIMALFE